jgi:hypothetical protein
MARFHFLTLLMQYRGYTDAIAAVMLGLGRTVTLHCSC